MLPIPLGVSHHATFFPWPFFLATLHTYVSGQGEVPVEEWIRVSREGKSYELQRCTLLYLDRGKYLCKSGLQEWVGKERVMHCYLGCS